MFSHQTMAFVMSFIEKKAKKALKITYHKIFLLPSYFYKSCIIKSLENSFSYWLFNLKISRNAFIVTRWAWNETKSDVKLTVYSIGYNHYIRTCVTKHDVIVLVCDRPHILQPILYRNKINRPLNCRANEWTDIRKKRNKEKRSEMKNKNRHSCEASQT